MRTFLRDLLGIKNFDNEEYKKYLNDHLQRQSKDMQERIAMMLNAANETEALNYEKKQRDAFAAAALPKLITWENGEIRPTSDAAIMAYSYADAMLKQRSS